MNTKNLDTALKAIRAEQDAEVSAEDLPAYIARIDELVAATQQLKVAHQKYIRAEASRKSRAKKADELAAMKARLAELESGAAK